MRRLTSLLLAGLLLTSLAGIPLAGAKEAKHSGAVVAVADDGRGFTLEVLGPGRSADANRVEHPVALTPETKVAVVTRSPQADPQGWRGNFVASPATAADIKPGAFVTVTVETRDGRMVARAVEILRPSPEGPSR
jgi:hypothetical protein